MKLFLNFILFIFFASVNVLQGQIFLDVTESLGIENITITNIDTRSDLYGNGASVADYDNDGDLDIFMGTQFSEPNRLYNNNGDGTFDDVTVTLGIDSQYRNRAALWIDYNGDQLLDLILLGDCYRADGCSEAISVFLYKQNINGSFDEVINSGLVFGNKYNITNFTENIVAGGLASADINNDGFLDLLVTVWGTSGTGAKLSLFLNNTDGTFLDISLTSFPEALSKSRWQPLFYDFNQDGYQDIYISIDFSENELWINNQNNTFENISTSAQVNSAFNEMGATIGDYDNDGDFDLYSTNITRVEDGELESRHNILLNNNTGISNDVSFFEVANEVNYNVGYSDWDWGTTFFEANNDGFLDLAVTNGWVERNNWPLGPSKLWTSIDGLFFNDSSLSANFNDTLDATTLLAFDMDRDGDLDLLQTIKQASGIFKPIRFYENNLTQSPTNNYLVVKPRMNGTNHFSIGTVVKIVYDRGSKTAMRLITAGTSFYGQEPAEAFFGLADNTIVDEIRVEWPDNTVTVVDNIAANQIITVTNDITLDVNSIEVSEVKAYPNPVKDILHLEESSLIKEIKVYNLLGQKIIHKHFNSKSVRLSLMALNPGNYFVKIINQANPIGKTILTIKK